MQRLLIHIIMIASFTAGYLMRDEPPHKVWQLAGLVAVMWSFEYIFPNATLGNIWRWIKGSKHDDIQPGR